MITWLIMITLSVVSIYLVPTNSKLFNFVQIEN